MFQKSVYLFFAVLERSASMLVDVNTIPSHACLASVFFGVGQHRGSEFEVATAVICCISIRGILKDGRVLGWISLATRTVEGVWTWSRVPKEASNWASNTFHETNIQSFDALPLNESGGENRDFVILL